MDTQGKQNSGNIQENSNLQAFHDEVVNLNVMNEKIDKALSEAMDTVHLADDEYMNLKRYMTDYRGELDPHEMFQNSLLLREIDHTGANKVGVLKVLEKIKESPYFARIDFQETGEEEVEIIYIGRFSFLFCIRVKHLVFSIHTLHLLSINMVQSEHVDTFSIGAMMNLKINE